MAVDDVRFQARRELEEAGLSVESAAYVAESRPAGGWDSLVTKDYLRAELAEVRTEIADLRSEFKDALSKQTWKLAGLVVAAQAVVVASIAAITAS